MTAFFLAGWLLAAPTPEALVRDLGANDFATRERATAALRELGPAALPALAAVENATDPEVRERARALLADLRLGITPDWPAELADLARGYRQLNEPDRAAVLQKVAGALKLKALRFLLTDRPASEKLLQGFADEGVAALRRALQQKQPATVRQLADQYRPLEDFDGRLLYLEAEALAEPAATACRQRALQMAGDREDLHYRAGELLQELKRDAAAAAEWQRILEIPPADDVYDANAYLRLADWKTRTGQFRAAADLLEKALKICQGKPGFAFVGGDEKQLAARVRALRQRAAGEDALPVTVRVLVKDNAAEKLARALAETVATVTIGVQPHGLRLFDLKQATLAYDGAKHELFAKLNGQRASPPVAAELEGPAKIAVRSLDCCYIYAVDPQAGTVTQEARFEMDYELQLKPEALPAGWTDLAVTLNDKAYDWAVAQKGIPLDYLPAKLTLVVRGTDADGKPQTLQLRGAVSEPGDEE